MKLEVLVIKTPSKIYISDNLKRENYFDTKLDKYLFDGEKAKSTYMSSWRSLPTLPTKVEFKTPESRNYLGYKLKAGYPISDVTPAFIAQKDWDEDLDIAGLYQAAYDVVHGKLEEVDFSYSIIHESDMNLPEVEFHGITYPLLTLITTPKELRQFTPCVLEGEALFREIGRYVKTHLTCEDCTLDDSSYAFRVHKKIKLTEPKVWQVDINQGTRRKPKYVTRSCGTTTRQILEVTYRDKKCSFPRIEADSAMELKTKFETIMEEIMSDINQKVVNCPCCQGAGVILEKEVNNG